jgi:outer membrane lipoprotein SlyB
MKKFFLGVAAAATVATPMMVIPDYSDARPRHRRHAVSERHYETRCHRDRRIRARRGTVIGAILGGVAGSQLAGRGARTEGTVIGAGVGAVAGHQIGRHRARC